MDRQMPLANQAALAYYSIGLRKGLGTNSSGGVENMKKHASIYLAGLISITTTFVCLGADGTVSSSPQATVVTPQGTPASTAAAQAPALAFGVSEVVKMYQ